jgi:hypothetical protein
MDAFRCGLFHLAVKWVPFASDSGERLCPKDQPLRWLSRLLVLEEADEFSVAGAFGMLKELIAGLGRGVELEHLVSEFLRSLELSGASQGFNTQFAFLDHIAMQEALRQFAPGPSLRRHFGDAELPFKH